MSELRAALASTVAAWESYIEAHAGRGHEGIHEPDPKLNDDCGPCAGAMYGTEVEMAEYVIPVARAALTATPSLDEAWKAVERALPEGWSWGGLITLVDDDGANAFWHAYVGPSVGYPLTSGFGPTPEAALTDLLRKLEDAS